MEETYTHMYDSPSTPRYALPCTVPASLARIQEYEPESDDRTAEISKSPVSNI